jgi:hypothetical protein
LALDSAQPQALPASICAWLTRALDARLGGASHASERRADV